MDTYDSCEKFKLIKCNRVYEVFPIRALLLAHEYLSFYRKAEGDSETLNIKSAFGTIDRR